MDIVFPTDFGATKDMGSSHTYRYVKIPAKPSLSTTTLWSNDLPTTGKASFDCSLSSSIGLYTYIGIYWRSNTSATTEVFLMTTPDIVRGHTSGVPRVCIGGISSSKLYARWLNYTSDTAIGFSSSYRLNNESGYANSTAIPTKIVGLK